MGQLRFRIIDTFTATDEDGLAYTINVLQGEHDTTTQWGRSTAPDALKEMRTDDGRFVNRVERGIYDVIDGTELIRLTSSDQNAL